MKKTVVWMLLGVIAIGMLGCGTKKNETADTEVNTEVADTEEIVTENTEAVENTEAGENTEVVESTEDVQENGTVATDVTLDSSCVEILDYLYATADLSADFVESTQYYDKTEIIPEMEEYILGTTEAEYIESVYSAPMMSSVAYQCVILKVEEGQDIEATKQLLLDSANPIKWVCVEAENVVVESNGNVILYVMGDNATTTALKETFLAL